MYSVQNNGVLKRIETWRIMIPLHDNDGNLFEKTLLDSILKDITMNFPGFTVVNCTGYWKGEEKLFVDKNIEVIIDTIQSSNDDSSEHFNKVKTDLQKKLKQEKIYITKESYKEEFLTFDEFFDEAGISEKLDVSNEQNKHIAEKFISRFDFILQRLAYETIGLRRESETQKIIWERKLCGIILKSILDDPYPLDLKIFAADQIDKISDSLLKEPFIIIGHYEYQNYILEKVNYRPLAKSNYDDDSLNFRLPSGELVSTGRFVEEFSATVFTNYVVLREEGYAQQEIKINVGNDGSLQIGESELGNNLFYSPAIISDKAIQTMIIDSLENIINSYENNTLDEIAFLQSKAKNHFIFSKVFIRNSIKRKNL